MTQTEQEQKAQQYLTRNRRPLRSLGCLGTILLTVVLTALAFLL